MSISKVEQGKYEVTMIWVNGVQNAIEIKMPMELNHIGSSIKEYITLLLSKPQEENILSCTGD